MNNLPKPAGIEAAILQSVRTEFELENENLAKGTKWPIPKKLEFSQIADIMSHLYRICTIYTAEEGNDTAGDLLAIYQTSGADEGTYSTNEEDFRRIARQYNYALTRREFDECMTALRDLVPRRQRCHERNLIAVNNGIFDYDTKRLFPFSPEYVFLSKSRVDYNPNAINPVIHNADDGTDWDVESWMSDLSDDPDVVNLLWEILGAIIRPNVGWGKSAWLYSQTGNNGKGTLCELMRRICGAGVSASIPLNDMGKDFALQPLIRASAIIVDENDVGTFIDKAANLKALITNDVVSINRKNLIPISYRFYGFMVQCLNELPRIKDKSDSVLRRQLFVPFEKCFTGVERKYIKEDYLRRVDVLEYVLHRVLHMNYYTLSEPTACTKLLNEYREYNDHIRQFADDILPNAQWNLLPFTFLFDLYRNWVKINMPSGKPQNRNTFINDLVTILKDYPEWVCPNKNAKIRTSGRMSATEPLLAQYDLKEWMNPHCKDRISADMTQKCTPIPGQLADNYRGILRISSMGYNAAGGITLDTDDSEE